MPDLMQWAKSWLNEREQRVAHEEATDALNLIENLIELMYMCVTPENVQAMKNEYDYALLNMDNGEIQVELDKIRRVLDA